MTKRRDAFAEMVTEAAKLLPDWQTYPHLAGGPEAHFADEIGRDVDVRMEPGGITTVTNWLPDGAQQHEVLTDLTPAALAAAVHRAAQAYDAADPARKLLDQALSIIAEPRTVEWRHRSATVEWPLPGLGYGSLSVGRAATGQHVRALAHLNFRNLSVETATPIVATATFGHPEGEAEGAGTAAQPLIKAAPALWLSDVLEDETGSVERAYLAVDDVHVTVTTGRHGRPDTVDVSVTSWVGPDVAAILHATPRP
ncbi:hypothetical protein GTY75_09165 [Streptomyces sp. SID8381]|uniref:hypothetical protein n=1 Tax=unclassified Streptomyces TaxID=2593676 RepID=UPI000368B44C|nr:MULTISPECIES: hypothetical protein [unclassified Streptomyces]MYX26836.1 hypothetical protein [Streptomyces sp. SID8381]